MKENKSQLFIDQLLDGASGMVSALSKESKALSLLVKDHSLSLTDRLESYEDIMNIEIGDTSMSRARNIEREMGFRQIYLKFEGGNPTGTQKDRIAFAQCHDALRREYNTITLATCGNYGAAMALAAQLANLECVICIPEMYHTSRIVEMERAGVSILRVPGTYEDAVDFSQELALKNEYYDANPGGINTPLQLKAYGEIAFEIYDVLRDAPKVLAAPVSNGTMLAGIYRGFVSLYKRGKTSRIPRIVAGSSFMKNPIIQSYKKGLSSCEMLTPEKIKESKINEPLINWNSLDGDEALYAIRESNGSAYGVSDQRMIYYSRLLKEKEGLSVLPASTAGMIGLLKLNEEEVLEGDRYVAVLTGRK